MGAKKKNAKKVKKTIMSHKSIKKAPSRSDSDTRDGFKKLSHEVFKYGMYGLDTKDKHEAKTKLLLKLGAKPKPGKRKPLKSTGP